MTTYAQTVEWLYTQLPVYQRSGGGAQYKIDLDKTHQLMELLDHPEQSFRSVHIAGTNGKGSVSHMLASIYQETGLKVGLYTSPHLRDFRERVRINGRMISEEQVIDFVEHYRDDFIRLQLSFFEMTVGLAFHCFREEQVDIAIVETGMGGRLDSTNVVTPLLSIITNIGMDHMSFLGNSLEQIAGEKAGIIKPGVPVLIGERQEEVRGVFEHMAREQGSVLRFAEDVVATPYPSDLKGHYQISNIRTAMAASNMLWDLPVSDGQLRSGLLNVVRNTGLSGRWQVLQNKPLVICDTAHNETGIRLVIDQLLKTPHKTLHFVWGMVNDKDIGGIMALLPKKASYYFCRPDIPRGLDTATLQAAAAEAGIHGARYESVSKALEAAIAAAHPDDLIFVGGSTFVVAEVV